MLGWSGKSTGASWDSGAGVSVVKSKGASSEGVTHTGLCLFTMPGLLGGTSPNRPIDSQAGYTQKRALT